MPIFDRLAKYTLGSTAAGTAGWLWYTRDVHFVHPFNTSSPEWQSSVVHRLNPTGNKPVLMDHAVRQVPISKLKTSDVEELTTEFCRGIWGGSGFTIQKHFLEKWHREKIGRQDHLWDQADLLKSDYEVGQKVADHFEVLVRAPGAVVWRCGDSPHAPTIDGTRASDGIFSMECTKDKTKAGEEVITFHLKSLFFNGLAGASKGSLPWWFDRAHKEYDKLWMCTSVNRLLK